MRRMASQGRWCFARSVKVTLEIRMIMHGNHVRRRLIGKVRP